MQFHSHNIIRSWILMAARLVDFSSATAATAAAAAAATAAAE